MAVGEWDNRQLCPDGGCVGVIGPDGTCKVCGHAALNWGDERNRGLNEPPDDEGDDELAADAGDDDLDGEYEDDDAVDDDDDGDDSDDEHGDSERAADADDSGASPPAGWTSRRLCPDGSCIGLIGADGRCKVCGRSAVPAPAEVERVAAEAEPATASAIDPDAARVCADPSCSGVIGLDDHCAVCGKVVA